MNKKVNYDEETHTWSVPTQTSMFNKSCSLGEISLFMLRSKPAAEIFQISVEEQTELTFGDAAKYAIIISQHLQNIGLTNEDVVGVFTANTTLLTPVIVGCWLNGIAYHALNPLSEEEVVKHIFGITKPRVIFCDGQYYTKLKAATKDSNTQFYTLCNHLEGVTTVNDILNGAKVCGLWFQPVPLKYGAAQTMAIYCTSGTTGPPKCVAYPNGRILVNAAFVNSTTVVYATSGPDWGTGLLHTVFNVVYGAKRIVTTKPITSAHIVEIIGKYGVTVLGVTPMELAALVELPDFNEHQLPTLQVLFVTGSPSTTKTLKQLKENFPRLILVESYGCTEFGSIAINTTHFEMDVLGTLSAGVDLRIIDPVSGSALGYNQSAEICVRNDLKWSGYIGADEAVNRAIFYEGGWMRTGDMGFMDESNILHFVDRYKDIMKYKGHQFSPNEIEAVISELDDVLDVCVFGVYDEHVGDQAAAAIVKRVGSNLSKNDIEKYVIKHEGVEYKRLHYGVYFVDEIVRNSNGKVLRNKMKDICLELGK